VAYIYIALYLVGLCTAVLAPLSAVSFVFPDSPVAIVSKAAAAAKPRTIAPLPDPNKPPVWIVPTRAYKQAPKVSL
jgi:hypothetical protein